MLLLFTLVGYGNQWQDLIVQAIERIEQHQMMKQQHQMTQQQKMLKLTTSQQQAIQRIKTKLVKQEKNTKSSAATAGAATPDDLGLQQANKQI